MTIWDGGWSDQSEPERESEWRDSDGPDLPFLPDPNEWVEPAEGEDPLYDLLKRDSDEEDMA